MFYNSCRKLKHDTIRINARRNKNYKPRLMKESKFYHLDFASDILPNTTLETLLYGGVEEMDESRFNFNPKYLATTIANKARYNQFTDKVINNVENIAFYRTKAFFGKEYYIDHNVLDLDSKFIKFIKKFDRQFKYHYDESYEKFNPIMTILKLDDRTFMYIATYQYVPGRSDFVSLYNENIQKTDMYIYVFGNKYKRYANMLDKILLDRRKNCTTNVIYSVNSLCKENTDISCINLENRYMDSLIYSYGEIDKVKNHLNQFNEQKQFYKEKQLNYKTGILLYGKPGTGKSSLVKTIATEFNRSIVSIDLSNIKNIDFGRLTMMINNERSEKYIVLLEDIDTLFLDREAAAEHEKEYQDIINKLLQFLDSTQSPNDVIFIATTNHPRKLDEALTRDGRFDLKMEVKELEKADILRFAKSFNVSEDKIKNIIEDYNNSVNNVEHELFNQSKLQNIMLKYIDNKVISTIAEDTSEEEADE